MKKLVLYGVIISFFMPMNGYKKFCYAVNNYCVKQEVENNESSGRQPQAKVPFGTKKVAYTFARKYARGYMRCHVYLKDKEKKRIVTILGNFTPDTHITREMIMQLKHKDPVMATVLHDFALNDNQMTVEKILKQLDQNC